MDNEKQLPDNVLFGEGDELVVRRHGRGFGSAYVAGKDLSGVKKFQLTIEGGKPIRYVIEGEVI